MKTPKIGLLIVLLTSVLLTASRACDYPRYTVIPLGTLGGETVATAINNRGQIVGSSETPSGVQHAFVWYRGRMTDLGALTPAGSSWAYDISNLGHVVGASQTAKLDPFYAPYDVPIEHAALWRDGKIVDLGALKGGVSSACSINDSDVIAGESSAGADEYGNRTYHPLIWRDTRITDISGGDYHFQARAINNQGTVAGDWVGSMAIYTYGAMWEPITGWRNLPNVDGSSFYGDASAINDRGGIVGDIAYHACLWQSGRDVKDLGTLGGFYSSAQGVNTQYDIVGWSEDVDRFARGFICKPGGKMTDLNSRIDPESGWTVTQAFDISDRGWIVASGLAPRGSAAIPLLLVPPQPPENVSLAPNQGELRTGARLTLGATYYDANMTSDITDCYLLIGDSLSGKSGVYLRYDAKRDLLYLRNDRDTSWLGGYKPGANRTIENSRCAIYCSESSTKDDWFQGAVLWRIALKPAMSGRSCKAWVRAEDRSGLGSGWMVAGDFQTR